MSAPSIITTGYSSFVKSGFCREISQDLASLSLVMTCGIRNKALSSKFHILQLGIPRAPGYFRLPFMKTRMMLMTVIFRGQDKNKNSVRFLLGNSLASEFYMPTFRNTLFHLHRQVGSSHLPAYEVGDREFRNVGI